jgi:hypothetical protein
MRARVRTWLLLAAAACGSSAAPPDATVSADARMPDAPQAEPCPACTAQQICVITCPGDPMFPACFDLPASCDRCECVPKTAQPCYPGQAWSCDSDGHLRCLSDCR